MTELPERAIARLQTSPESEQNMIASIILDEIEDEQRFRQIATLASLI